MICIFESFLLYKYNGDESCWNRASISEGLMPSFARFVTYFALPEVNAENWF